MAGHVTLIGKMNNAYKTYFGNLRVDSHSEDLGVDGKMILGRFLGEKGGKAWTGWIWLRIGTRCGLL